LWESYYGYKDQVISAKPTESKWAQVDISGTLKTGVVGVRFLKNKIWRHSERLQSFMFKRQKLNA